MTDNNINFDTMTQSEFEQHLPDFFAAGGHVSEDPRLQRFLAANPDCAALVRDLETIAEHAKSLFDPVGDPSDNVWANIQKKLQDDPITSETGIPAGVKAGTQTESGALSLNGEPDQLVTGGSLHDLE